MSKIFRSNTLTNLGYGYNHGRKVTSSKNQLDKKIRISRRKFCAASSAATVVGKRSHAFNHTRNKQLLPDSPVKVLILPL